jgi:Ca2+-binding EF-hand superfamily protein
MNLLTLGLSAAALTAAGLAHAQPVPAQPAPPREVTREQARAGAEKLFAAMDLNHDGKLDAADREVRLGRMFERIDADHDGKITQAEFLAAHRDGAEHHGETPGPAGMMRARALGMGAEILREADPQRSGTVSHDAFISTALALFDRTDANHDGKVTPEERRAAMAGRMGRPGGGHRMGSPAMGGMDMHDDDMMPPAGE